MTDVRAIAAVRPEEFALVPMSEAGEAEGRGPAPADQPRAMITVTPEDRGLIRVPWSHLLRNKAHEFTVKARGNRIKGQGMISASAADVRRGFAALSKDDFREYNLPQEWVEARQIPTAIDGRIPVLDAVVLDLGCGPGTSTRILCHFADPSWRILGFDLTRPYIEVARAHAGASDFRNRSGQAIEPQFECQDISEPLLSRGALLGDATADFAVSGGVVGLYMHKPAAERLIAELWRVIRPGGFIALDAGPSMPPKNLQTLATAHGFVFQALAKSFIIEPRPKLIFRKPHSPRP